MGFGNELMKFYIWHAKHPTQNLACAQLQEARMTQITLGVADTLAYKLSDHLPAYLPAGPGFTTTQCNGDPPLPSVFLLAIVASCKYSFGKNEDNQYSIQRHKNIV